MKQYFRIITRLTACALILCQSSMIYSQVYSELCHDMSQWPMVYMPASTFDCSAYEEAFFDDFLDENDMPYEGQPDLNVWELYDSPDADNVYSPDQVSVKDGFCYLKPKHVPEGIVVQGANGPYTVYVEAGAIRTKAEVPSGEFRYGYYEAKMKVSEQANWKTSFWMAKHDEVDVMENFGSRNQYYYTVHSGYDSTGPDVYCTSPPENPVFGNLDREAGNTYAVEITPFAKTFYFNGNELPTKTYKFYTADENPLKVDCANPTIPEGYYYINPAFMQIRSRLFRPLINFKAKSGYDDEVDFPAELRIDYMKVSTMDFDICGHASVYGPNMFRGGDGVEPYRAQPHCIGDTSSLYVEDLNCNDYHCEVTFDENDVTHSNDIEIIEANDEHEIKYIQHSCGEGRITINYIDGCGNNAILNYIIPKAEGVSYEITDNNHCHGKLSIEMDLNLECGIPNIDQITAINKWNQSVPVNYTLTQGVLDLDLTGLYFLRNILIEFDNCAANIEIPLDVCDTENCCPEGSEWDGANCYIGVYIPDGYNEFFIGNELYTEYGTGGLDQCPEGSFDTGEDCYLGNHFPQGYDGFIFQNKLYVHDDCSVEFCCPEGFEWNGKNCVTVDKPFGKGNGWIDEEGNIFLETDDSIEWCPLKPCYCGHEWNQAEDKCETGEKAPLGFEGEVVDGNLVLDPNCNTCCPEGFEFDGKECVGRTDLTNVTTFMWNNWLALNPDCSKYIVDNNCCPVGFTRIGDNCVLVPGNAGGEVDASSTEIIVTREAERCENKSEKRSKSNMDSTAYGALADTKILVYPNPFTDDIFIQLKDYSNGIVSVKISSLQGEVLYRKEIEEVYNEQIKLDLNLPSGIYVISIANGTNKFVEKLIKL